MANHEEENKAKSSRRNFLRQSSVALVGGAVANTGSLACPFTLREAT